MCPHRLSSTKVTSCPGWKNQGSLSVEALFVAFLRESLLSFHIKLSQEVSSARAPPRRRSALSSVFSVSYKHTTQAHTAGAAINPEKQSPSRIPATLAYTLESARACATTSTWRCENAAAGFIESRERYNLLVILLMVVYV